MPISKSFRALQLQFGEYQHLRTTRIGGEKVDEVK